MSKCVAYCRSVEKKRQRAVPAALADGRRKKPLSAAERPFSGARERRRRPVPDRGSSGAGPFRKAAACPAPVRRHERE